MDFQLVPTKDGGELWLSSEAPATRTTRTNPGPSRTSGNDSSSVTSAQSYAMCIWFPTNPVPSGERLLYLRIFSPIQDEDDCIVDVRQVDGKLTMCFMDKNIDRRRESRPSDDSRSVLLNEATGSDLAENFDGSIATALSKVLNNSDVTASFDPVLLALQKNTIMKGVLKIATLQDKLELEQQKVIETQKRKGQTLQQESLSEEVESVDFIMTKEQEIPFSYASGIKSLTLCKTESKKQWIGDSTRENYQEHFEQKQDQPTGSPDFVTLKTLKKKSAMERKKSNGKLSKYLIRSCPRPNSPNNLAIKYEVTPLSESKAARISENLSKNSYTSHERENPLASKVLSKDQKNKASRLPSRKRSKKTKIKDFDHFANASVADDYPQFSTMHSELTENITDQPSSKSSVNSNRSEFSEHRSIIYQSMKNISDLTADELCSSQPAIDLLETYYLAEVSSELSFENTSGKDPEHELSSQFSEDRQKKTLNPKRTVSSDKTPEENLEDVQGKILKRSSQECLENPLPIFSGKPDMNSELEKTTTCYRKAKLTQESREGKALVSRIPRICSKIHGKTGDYSQTSAKSSKNIAFYSSRTRKEHESFSSKPESNSFIIKGAKSICEGEASLRSAEAREKATSLSKQVSPPPKEKTTLTRVDTFKRFFVIKHTKSSQLKDKSSRRPKNAANRIGHQYCLAHPDQRNHGNKQPSLVKSQRAEPRRKPNKENCPKTSKDIFEQTRLGKDGSQRSLSEYSIDGHAGMTFSSENLDVFSEERVLSLPNFNPPARPSSSKYLSRVSLVYSKERVGSCPNLNRPTAETPKKRSLSLRCPSRDLNVCSEETVATPELSQNRPSSSRCSSILQKRRSDRRVLKKCSVKSQRRQKNSQAPTKSEGVESLTLNLKGLTLPGFFGDIRLKVKNVSLKKKRNSLS